MGIEASQLMDDESSAYLGQLQMLVFEMNEGMKAIANNSVDVLKESIAKQEVLCASLAASAVANCQRFKRLSQSSIPPSETAVELTIWKASNTIRQLNLQYATLLKHSGRTVTLLSSLCNTHTGIANESPGLWSKRQTWSCEI